MEELVAEVVAEEANRVKSSRQLQLDLVSHLGNIKLNICKTHKRAMFD